MYIIVLIFISSFMDLADKFVYANVSNKLQMIAEQVRFLQEQAKRTFWPEVLLYAEPTKWGGSPPHEFEGSSDLSKISHGRLWRK
ncbi:hypothetical protein Avbf_11512 [Armadillidium vulgare]|nr:hypothetical protein Avbf_11512 [Armadillidium vulgare]